MVDLAAGPTPDAIAIMVLALALYAAFAAMLARSFFALATHVALIGMCCAAALLAMQAGRGATILIAAFSGLGAFIMAGASLLSARASDPIARVTILLPAFAGGAILVALLGGGVPRGNAVAPLVPLLAHEGWIAIVVLACAAGAVGALGYGERGALELKKDTSHERR